MRLLSVDWDFFFPIPFGDPALQNLYDWGCRDGGVLFLQELWYHRAAAFMYVRKPLPKTSGEENTFWKRFRFHPKAKLFFSDSHMHIYSTDIQEMFLSGRRRLHDGTIDSYDAHHDAGYSGTLASFIRSRRVTCADWVAAYKLLGISTRVYYPHWHSDALQHEPEPIVSVTRRMDTGRNSQKPYDAVFVCRSGGWTPPWLDTQFFRFVQACPVADRNEIGNLPMRQWDTKRLVVEAAAFRKPALAVSSMRRSRT